MAQTRKLFTHRHFYTHKFLHTDAFTHRNFYTQNLLHTDACTHRNTIFPHFLAFVATFQSRNFTIYSFWRSSLISCDKISADTQNRNFTRVFGDQTLSRAKGLRPTLQNRNFTTIFGDRTLFRATRFRPILKIAILLHFLVIEPSFVRKGCRGHFKITI